MLNIRSLNPDKRLSVTIAIFFAEDALPIWERQCPEDMRPKKAIEAAKAWLINPCEKIAAASNAAASNATASYAAYAASAAAADAASAAAAAASYAAYAAYAAYNVSYTASYAAYAASAAAADAADAAADAVLRAADTLCYADFYIHSKLVQLLPHLFEYKLHAKTSFKDSEQVLNLLSEKNQQRFLFNLNHLR